MTTKVNGHLFQGSWFERDTSILTVTAAGFLADTVGGVNQQIMTALQTRGTVIGYTVESDTVAHYLFGHAAGAFDAGSDIANGPVVDVLAELIAAAPGVTDIVVFKGFAGADPADVTHS